MLIDNEFFKRIRYYENLNCKTMEETDYDAKIQADAEMQYHLHEQYKYEQYLDNLIETKQFDLFTIEKCLDLHNKWKYSKGLNPSFIGYLQDLKMELQTPKEISNQSKLDF